MHEPGTTSGTHRVIRFSLYALVALIVLTVLFYVVEDWRGRREWQRYKQESAARGLNLDWAAQMPPPVPDDQNFFSAPEMEAWFVGRGMNAFSSRISFHNFVLFKQDGERHPLAKVVVVPTGAAVAPGDADIILQYDKPSLTVANLSENPKTNAPGPAAIPLIVMDEVPLREAIKAFAKQDHLKYQLHANIASPEPTVSIRWTNITATAALLAVLDNYSLIWVANPKTGVAQIENYDRAVPVREASSLRSQIGGLITNTLASGKKLDPSKHLTSALGFELTADPLDSIQPARIIVRTDGMLGSEDIKSFFPQNVLEKNWTGSQLYVAGDGTNFDIYLHPLPELTAADYLAWSDQFTNDFANVHAALQRPYARMSGNYAVANYELLPSLNFIPVRMVAQMLAMRAQSDLLLNKPDAALRELTLLHEFPRMMEGRPTGKPMTLIAAMINVAVTGLYVSAVADGLRLQEWREPQLAVLQRQLGEINLLPYVHDAFEFEAALHGRMAETFSSREMAEMRVKSFQSYGAPSINKYKDPTYIYLTLAPQGWLYQNVVFGARLELGTCEDFDVANHLVRPKRTDDWIHKTEASFKHISPYNYYAAELVPSFVRTVQITAKNQTLANQACIVCALERHRLAHGKYPASLEELAVEFATHFPSDIIGGAPLKYRVEDGRFILYSVGWNERDDGGKPCWDKTADGDLTKDDWVWPYTQLAAK